MAWIKVIKKEEAEGDLKDLYDHVLETDDDIDNILSIHSLHPKTLEAHLMMYEELMRGPGNLSKAQREMLGVLVSTLNACEY
ncbi:peroxidase [Acidaminobacter sp. JC074]|nr:peroxidase [Acidaminobacter sp. JC074]